MAKFTKQHYILIAKAYRQAHQGNASDIEVLLSLLVYEFKLDNPLFKAGKFYQACGAHQNEN